MEEIYVFVAEGTLYKCDKENAQATLSSQEWETLDLSQQFSIDNGKVVNLTVEEEKQPPVITIPSPLPLEMMYERNGVGEKERIDALWDIQINQDRTKADNLIEKRASIKAEHERLTKEYESQR